MIFQKKQTLAALLLAALFACKTPTLFQPTGAKITQIAVPRIEKMPRQPQPYKFKDWKQAALDFDRIAYNYGEKGEFFPIIWDDPAKRNGFNQSTFGLYTALGDVREGAKVNNGENHEALGSLGSILTSTMMGIDKSDQNGRNYVAMSKNYFNRENGWNIVMNFTSKDAHIGGGYGNDWWYDVLNNVLFYAIGDQYPDERGYSELMRTIADQFYRSDSVMGKNYSYSFFDYKNRWPEKNHIPAQEDCAAGYAFILNAAYIKFGDEKYLRAAKNALKVLESQKENRSYEILMSFAPYMAARMNAENGADFDVQKLMNWSFDGDAVGRVGWGVLADNWGGYDVSGMMGSTVDMGGYGFAMNTFQLAWPLTAMVRYDQRYARAVGKWMLNASNSARFFYPDEMPDSLQALPARKSIAKGVIAYEGFIKSSNHPQFKNITPFAQGDGPLWAPGMPIETMFSIYGSGQVGFFGATIEPTNVDKVLKINCLATDFFKKGKAWPTFLFYNPFSETKKIVFDAGPKKVDIYDTVSRQVLRRGVRGMVNFDLAGDAARVLVLIPAGSSFEKKNGQLMAGGAVVDFLR